MLCLAMGMIINYEKSTCFHTGIEDQALRLFHDVLVEQMERDKGFKYLGFHLKPNNIKGNTRKGCCVR